MLGSFWSRFTRILSESFTRYFCLEKMDDHPTRLGAAGGITAPGEEGSIKRIYCRRTFYYGTVLPYVHVRPLVRCTRPFFFYPAGEMNSPDARLNKVADTVFSSVYGYAFTGNLSKTAFLSSCLARGSGRPKYLSKNTPLVGDSASVTVTVTVTLTRTI